MPLTATARRFALERITTYKPDPAKFLAALADADRRGDTHVIRKMALASEKFATHGENAKLAARARQVFRDGARRRVDQLVLGRSATGHVARVEEALRAHAEMHVAPPLALLAEARRVRGLAWLWRCLTGKA